MKRSDILHAMSLCAVLCVGTIVSAQITPAPGQCCCTSNCPGGVGQAMDCRPRCPENYACQCLSGCDPNPWAYANCILLPPEG